MSTSKIFSLAAGLSLLTPALPLGAANVFSSGHGDVFAVGYMGGQLEPHVHIENGIVNGVNVPNGEYPPNQITTLVPQSTFDYIQSQGGRPAGATWDPIGVAAGAPFYFLPQADSGPGGASALGAPFAGVGTEELPAASWTTPISIQLISVAGPGHFSFWQSSGPTTTFHMSSADGINGSDVYTQAAGAHDHASWGFTAPGIYSITVQVSGTHATDGPKTANATYQFAVGIPEPSTGILAMLAGGLLLARRSRRR